MKCDHLKQVDDGRELPCANPNCMEGIVSEGMKGRGPMLNTRRTVPGQPPLVVVWEREYVSGTRSDGSDASGWIWVEYPGPKA